MSMDTGQGQGSGIAAVGYGGRSSDEALAPAGWLWLGFAVVALLLMDVVDLAVWGVVVPATAVVIWVMVPFARVRAETDAEIDRGDLIAVGVLWVAVVVSFWTAFDVFSTDRVEGLFLAFAVGLVAGVAGPLWWVVWHRGQPLSALGLTSDRWRATVGIGILLAGVQFAMTLWRYELPEPEDWVPLLVMSLVVGFFEAVFFRGFIQGRLEASFGMGPAVLGAAVLYSLYHVGYGMASDEMVFLFGLGVVYAVAFRLVSNILVLWPLLTPLGAFYNNVDAGDIDLPWASIAGFADVAVAMAVAVWFTARHCRGTLRRRSGSVNAEHQAKRRTTDGVVTP
jgi:membrane protease YdiL (CAAX protease family)